MDTEENEANTCLQGRKTGKQIPVFKEREDGKSRAGLQLRKSVLILLCSHYFTEFGSWKTEIRMLVPVSARKCSPTDGKDRVHPMVQITH